MIKFYFTNQTVDRQLAREKELRIERETGLVLDNPFYDGDAKEVKALDATGTSNLTCDEIVGRDLKRIKDSHGLIALMTNDKDIGSCMEIAIASLMWGRPVYTIALNKNALNHPWIHYFSDRVFANEYAFIKFAKEHFPEVREFIEKKNLESKRKKKWSILPNWLH